MSITCPECGSDNVTTERRPNGESKCIQCGYRDLTSEFIRHNEAPSYTYLQKENEQLKYYKEQWQLIAGKANLKNLIATAQTLQKENEELRADLLYFWTWVVGGYESRPETRLNVELEKMEERYEWLKGEAK